MTEYDPADVAHRRPFNLQQWIDDHRHELRPPVANKQVWREADMIVMIVGGGNERNDFHDDPREEFFYQIKGDMELWIWPEPGVDPYPMTIREGDVYLLPPHLRHSPQRPTQNRLAWSSNTSATSASWMASNGRAPIARMWCIELSYRCKRSTRIYHHSLPPSMKAKRHARAPTAAPFTLERTAAYEPNDPPLRRRTRCWRSVG